MQELAEMLGYACQIKHGPQGTCTKISAGNPVRENIDGVLTPRLAFSASVSFMAKARSTQERRDGGHALGFTASDAPTCTPHWQLFSKSAMTF